MQKPLLTTKLFIPKPRSTLVPRPRLIDHLNRGLRGKLTLISAPAGFGKTTLLSEFARQHETGIAWVSLDKEDNDPVRFLTYLITALARIGSGIGDELVLSLENAKTPDTNSVLARLVNEITGTSQSTILVLDDYHVIVEPEIQEMMLFFLENLPAEIHLVISSRSDPPWPLARYRVRGEMNEIRSNEIRFTQKEAVAFLNDVMGFSLSLEDVTALESRTEGWIAGLQMAALSMRGRADVAGFIRSFTGSHRYVIDYLMEEVLEQQPPGIQDFLMKTSILERLSGDLCDAVTRDQPPVIKEAFAHHSPWVAGASQVILESLEHNNLFLIPLDDQRRWYRYHHLFADLLRNRLLQEAPETARRLHRQASKWYEAHDYLTAAIQHALLSDDVAGIAALLEKLPLHTLKAHELKMILQWVDNIDKDTQTTHPWLMVARAWALTNTGQVGATKNWLDEIDHLMAEGTFENPELRDRIQGHTAAIRAYIAEVYEDAQHAIQAAYQALDCLPDDELALRAFTVIRLANCLSWAGKLDQAREAYEEAYAYSRQIGDDHLSVVSLAEMAATYFFKCQIHLAERTLDKAEGILKKYARRDGYILPSAGIVYRQRSRINYEHNHLEKALHYSRESVKYSRQWGEKDNLFYACLSEARDLQALGDIDGMRAALQEAIEISNQIGADAVEYAKIWEANFLLLQGDLSTAIQWVKASGIHASDDFDYANRVKYALLARILLAQGKPTQARPLIARLKEIAESAGVELMVVHYSLFEVIADYQTNNTDRALSRLEEVFSITEPQGIIRMFVNAGSPIEALLRQAITKGVHVFYARKLLDAVIQDQKGRTLEKSFPMVEPLSERELEVLRLLTTDLSAPDIAETLVISPSTVRTHIKNIYSKLDVHSRHEAVSKARDLGVL